MKTKWLKCVFFLAGFGLSATPAGAVVVAVLDTGVNATGPLVGKVLPGVNVIDGTSNAADDEGHGTQVAIRVINVANSAQIFPVKVLDDEGTGTSQNVLDGILAATAQPNVRVMNFSLGGDGITPQELEALRQAAQKLIILVFAAGNDGAAQPTFPAAHAPGLGGLALAVGSVDAGNVIQDYSNRAGAAAKFYVVEFDDDGGTSFAAPRVSGALAVILEQAPHLNGRQAITILLATTDDLGAAGPDAIYGMGKPNLTRALQAIPPLVVPTGANTGGSSASLGPAALAIAAAVAAVLWQRSKKAAQTLVLDRFERGYVVDLTKRLEIRNTLPSLTSIFASLGNRFSQLQVPVMNGLRMNLSYAQPKYIPGLLEDEFDLRDSETANLAQMAVSLNAQTDNGLRLALNLNTSPQLALAQTAVTGTEPAFLTNRALSTPYLSFGELADSVQVGYDATDRLALNVGVTRTNEAGRFGRQSTGAVIEGTYEVSERVALKFQFGQIAERGSFFGGAAGGAFGVEQSETVAAGITAQVKLHESVTWISHYAEGVTRVQDTNNSLLQNFTRLRSRTFGMGLIAKDLFTKGDRLGLAVSRPLRVTNGSADLIIPYARDVLGNVYRSNENINLNPKDAETDFELYYYRRIGKKTNVGSYFLYRKNPNHAADLPDERTIFAIISREL